MRTTDCIHTNAKLSLTGQPLPTWRAWAATGGRKLARDGLALLVALFEITAVWSERARQRRSLAALDDGMLKDLGLSRVDVWREAGKPVWRD